jgi:thiol-disulfide isomerase/thioredoxin
MMKNKTIFLPFMMLAVILCAAFCFNQKEVSSPPKGKAPEISLVSHKGKKIKLSKLKGKYVLIDFWASWCGPCRKEIPNVVEAYSKYKNRKFLEGKGLVVFSVSLDKDEAAWKSAIQSDQMNWSYHGLDADGKVSERYGVYSIPSAFLVNGKGDVVAQGQELRGLNLHITLDKYLAP